MRAIGLTLFLGCLLVVATPALADRVESGNYYLRLVLEWRPVVDPARPVPTECVGGCSLPYPSAGFVTVAVGGAYRGSGSITNLKVHWGDAATTDVALPGGCFSYSGNQCPVSHVYQPRATPYHVSAIVTASDGRSENTFDTPLFVCWTGSRTCGG